MRGRLPVSLPEHSTDGPDQGPALRDVAVAVATEAAAPVRARRREGVAVAATKSTGTDIVTDTDRESEALLMRRLGELRPGDGFFGEEGGESGTSSTTGVTWVVDPIDGTVNFLYGVAPYAVSVAAVDDRGDSLAGAVVDVTSGEVFSAARGEGASLDGHPLRVREPAPMAERLVLTGFQYEAERRVLQAQAVTRMIGQVRDIRRIGCAALDLCAIARGAADAYVEEGLHLWDRAAAQLVVSEAGGVVGVHPGVGGMECVVAAPVATYDELLALVRDCGFLADEGRSTDAP
jgi:myo-inositol-1(or 4)-monophosphatase